MEKSGRKAADERLAFELAAGRTLKEAAAAAGVSASTADRRQRDPEFRKRVAEIRTAMITDATGRLSAGMTKAADVLVKLLGHKNADTRRHAAVKLIELAAKMREHGELADRVAELEKLVAARRGKP